MIHFKLSRLVYNIFGFFNQRFLIELFNNEYITNIVLKLGGQTTKVLDNGSITFIGPYGLELALVKLSRNISTLDSGIITSYALYILAGFIYYLLLFRIEDSIIILLVLYGSFFIVNRLEYSVKSSLPRGKSLISKPLTNSMYCFNLGIKKTVIISCIYYPVLPNIELCLTDIGLYIVIALFIILMAVSTTWFTNWGVDTRWLPNHPPGVPSEHYELTLARGSSGHKTYWSSMGVAYSHLEFKARSKPYDLVTDKRPHSETRGQTLFACEIATRSN